MQKCNQDKGQEISWDQKLMSEFPILYCQRDKNKQETCLCYGLECEKGWAEPIRHMSAKLETLNLMFYPKYRIRIQANQIKEKYGTLHAYTSVINDPGPVKCLLNRIFTRAWKWIDSHVDFKMVEIEDHPTYDKTEIVELNDRAEFIEAQRVNKNISNVKVEEKDGRYFKSTTYTCYRRFHTEPTKHLLIRKIMTALRLVAYSLDEVSVRNWKQEVIYDYLTTKSDKIVREAENECYNVCEKCGHQIGTSWSPRCETRGWVTYICNDCAKTSGKQYFKNGALFKGDKMLKTKEDVDAELAATEEKYRKRCEHENAEFENEMKDAKEENEGKEK